MIGMEWGLYLSVAGRRRCDRKQSWLLPGDARVVSRAVEGEQPKGHAPGEAGATHRVKQGRVAKDWYQESSEVHGDQRT